MRSAYTAPRIYIRCFRLPERPRSASKNAVRRASPLSFRLENSGSVFASNCCASRPRPESRYGSGSAANRVAEVCAMSMEAWGRSMRGRLTGRKLIPRVCLAGQDFRASRLASDSTSGDSIFDAYSVHSRDVSVLLHVRRDAGVFFGIDSEAISESRRPTRQTARWVFCFAAVLNFPSSLKGHRWRSG